MENEFLNGIIISYSKLLREIRILKEEVSSISKKLELKKHEDVQKTNTHVDKENMLVYRKCRISDGILCKKTTNKIRQKSKKTNIRKNKLINKISNGAEIQNNYNFFKEIEEGI